ncbi:hypothetical protein [Sulfuriroseicoccus oceanibius]|uniref:Uncharacterized protein n=1 Tax=Sulfuriroseicoccus oceanibius TaxID=2707525 RepID=A0A6B3L5K6_9BACT|nr:hypothetical protein [Sulfuriroseicoccus oceanibius]QQL44210.1 hypothetical protein G3M56_009920 [Sulfuriroseicoccus oceanibius]
MSTPQQATSRQTPEQAFGHDYLEMRIRLIEIGAMLDRLDRARTSHPDAPQLTEDDRIDRCRQALEVIISEAETPNRAERIALIFSDLD